MARRKGKSQRRIKDWYHRYVEGEDFTSDSASRERFSEEVVKLPPSRDGGEQSPEIGIEELDRTEGMVTGFFPGGAIVRLESGEELLCAIAKTFRAPDNASALAVGDDVTIGLTRSGHADAAGVDKDRVDGMVLAREPRRTALSRPQPRSGKRRDEYGDELFEKVIAANMDVLLIVASTRQPPLRHGLIDRFLIIAERGELKPILAINKIDLGKPDDRVLQDFEHLGVEIHHCSAQTGQGLSELKQVLNGKRNVFAGASGVGKSSLINAMIPGTNAATQNVRVKDERGRHTTTASVVYKLDAGGLLVDTPGIRELGMTLQAGELPWYFPEFEQLASQCKFNDCTHTHEPKCAIQQAVESGEISERRYESYLRLRETIDER